MASKTINELTLKLNADMAELKKDLANIKGNLKGFSKDVGGIGATLRNAFKVTAVVAAGKALIDFGREVTQLGGQLAGVKAAYEKIATPALLEEMKAATLGTISDLNLMKQTLTAKEFNLPIEKMGSLMQFATQQGQKLGKSIDYMSESLITGLARGSLPILDNLGLSSKELQSEMKKTGNVTEAAFNVINKKLAESGGLMETATTIQERWGARWDNLKANVGLLINNALVKISPILEDIGKWFTELWRKGLTFVIDTYNGWADLYDESMAFRVMVQSIGGVFTTIGSIVKFVFSGIWNAIKSVGSAIGYLVNPKNWGAGFGKGLTEIMAKNAAALIANTKEMGSDIGNSFIDAAKEAANGKAKRLSFDDFVLGGKGAEIITQAGKFGEEVKAKIIKALSVKEKIDAIDVDKILDLEAMDNAFRAGTEKISGFIANVNQVTFDMTEQFKTMLTDSVVSMSENIGEALAGGTSLIGGVLFGFLGIIIDFASNLGKQLIALGIAGIALKKLMMNPWTAIAAGIALVALSAGVKKLINKGGPKFAMGGIVPGNSYSGDRVPILANSGEMILNSSQQGNLFRQLNGGSALGGTLTARVSGNDLLFILEQTRKKQNSTY